MLYTQGLALARSWPHFESFIPLEAKLVSLRDDTTQQMDGCWGGKQKVVVGVVNKKWMDGGSQRASR